MSVELCWRTVLNSILVKFLSSKKGHYSQKKNLINISCGYAHQHIKSLITTKFQEILLSGFRGVALTSCFSSILHFGQISKLKKGENSEKKKGIKISCGYAHLHIMSFITTKFPEILLSGFRGVALTRKQDWLTDWLTDGSKTLYPPQLIAWGIIRIFVENFRYDVW